MKEKDAFTVQPFHSIGTSTYFLVGGKSELIFRHLAIDTVKGVYA